MRGLGMNYTPPAWSQTAQGYLSNAQSAYASMQRATPEQQKTLGGGLGSAVGGAMAGKAVGGAFAGAAAGAGKGSAAGPVGAVIGAGVGLLAYYLG